MKCKLCNRQLPKKNRAVIELPYQSQYVENKINLMFSQKKNFIVHRHCRDKYLEEQQTQEAIKKIRIAAGLEKEAKPFKFDFSTTKFKQIIIDDPFPDKPFFSTPEMKELSKQWFDEVLSNRTKEFLHGKTTANNDQQDAISYALHSFNGINTNQET